MKGKQHKEGHKKDEAHQGQQHVAANEQSVHYLQEKDDSDEIIAFFFKVFFSYILRRGHQASVEDFVFKKWECMNEK